MPDVAVVMTRDAALGGVAMIAQIGRTPVPLGPSDTKGLAVVIVASGTSGTMNGRGNGIARTEWTS
jgi:hypothetical protein